MITILLLSCIFSCTNEKKSKEPIDIEELWHCHHQHEWNKEQIESHIVGTWRWVYHYSPFSRERSSTEYDNLKVVFKSNKLVGFEIDDKVEYISKWALKPSENGGGFYEIEVKPKISNQIISNTIEARLMFCDDFLVSRDIKVLYNNYFKREL